MAATRNSLYEKVVRVTHDYLGPAADRFITRQIRNHLDKDPAQFKPKDLEELIDWIRLAMTLLTDDEKLISEYLDRLQTLAENKRGNPVNADTAR